MSGKRGREISERFWSKVDIRGGDECWNWTGARDQKGYGHFQLIHNPSPAKSHRFAWELTYGKIPPGMLICHHCDNPSCVRPDHLFIGTNADNAHDRDNKNRRAAPEGEKNGFAKLNSKQVDDIRRLYSSGTFCQRELGLMFGVSRANISLIVSGKHWK